LEFSIGLELDDHGGYRHGVAAFDPQVELTHPADYRLMMNTFVTLFRSTDLLQRSTDQLSALGYDIV
jgi:hypothetical protein